MGVFDFLRPSIKEAENAYNAAKAKYMTSQLAIQGLKTTYDQKRDLHNTLLMNNTALMVVGSAIVKSDEAYQKLIEDAAKPMDDALKPEGYSEETLQHWDSVPGGGFIKGALNSFDRISKSEAWKDGPKPISEGIAAVSDILYGFAIGGINVIPGTEKIPIPTFIKQVAAFPLQVMAAGPAVALDFLTVVFSPGAKKDKFDDAKAKVDKAQTELDDLTAQVTAANAELDKEIAKLKGQFLQVCGRLDALAPHDYLNTLSIDSGDDAFLDVQNKALKDFGSLIDIRNSYLKLKKGNPSLSDEQIADFLADQKEWAGFTQDEIRNMVNLVVRLAKQG